MTTAPRKPFLPFDAAGIPPDLRACGTRFIAWKGTPKTGGKWDKKPLRYAGGAWVNGDATNPGTWMTFDDAVAAHQAGAGDGVSICMSPNDDLTGIDIDHCVERRGDELVIADEAQRIMAMFPPTIWMLSVSGTGIRGFVGARKPAGSGAKRGNVEAYDQARHLTLTGHLLPQSAQTIARGPEAAAALAAFCAEYLAAPPKERYAPTVTPAPAVSDDNVELLERARRATNGQRFTAYFDRGELCDKPTISEAELGLCNMLRFWTGADPVRMDQLFRQSALYQQPGRAAKWDAVHYTNGMTYGEHTIVLALSGPVYQTPRRLAPSPAAQPSTPDEDNGPDLPNDAGDMVSWEVFEQLAAELRARDEVIAVQQARIAALEAENADLRARFAGIAAVVEAPPERLRGTEKGVSLALTHGVFSAEDRTPQTDAEAAAFVAPSRAVYLPEIARKAGVSDDLVGKVIKKLTTGPQPVFYRTDRFETRDRVTGAPLPHPKRIIELRPALPTIAETYQAIANLQPAQPNPKHGGARQHCPQHPDADTYTVTYCAACHAAVDGTPPAPPFPQDAGMETPPPSVVAVTLLPPDVGMADAQLPPAAPAPSPHDAGITPEPEALPDGLTRCAVAGCAKRTERSQPGWLCAEHYERRGPENRYCETDRGHRIAPHYYEGGRWRCAWCASVAGYADVAGGGR